MRPFRLSRRTLLRGSIGGIAVSLGLPPLEVMFDANGTAHADGTGIPRRLGVFFWGVGVKIDRWNPTMEGAAWTPSPALEPLAAVKDYVTVVSGMDLPTGRGHRGGFIGALSAAPPAGMADDDENNSAGFSMPTVDQVAAVELGKTTRFRSLELGISTRIAREGSALAALSHTGPTGANPPEHDPVKVFDRLFGADMAPAAPGVTSDVSRMLRKSMLDAVAGDVTRLGARVSRIDRQRLDQHLDNLRQIEKRLTGPDAITCTPPARPTNPATQDGKEPLAERMQAMSDLLAMALACDQTRVFSVMFSGAAGSTVFWQVGADTGFHQITHNEEGDQPTVHKATVFTMEQFARLISALKAVPEGAENLLDHTAILATSELTEGREHSVDDHPFLVAGRAGGALRYPGIHYRSPGEPNGKLLLSLVRAVGVPATQFGGGSGMVSESCTAIEV